MAKDVPLPAAFDPDREPDQFLAGIKKRAATNFSLTKRRPSKVPCGWRKDKTGERNWSLTALTELCVLIELGGSKTWPVAALEREFRQVVARLRALLKVP